MRQYEGDCTDGLYVGRHVIAVHAVTPGHGLGEPSVHVGEGNRQPVVLHLTAHLEVLARQSLPDALVPVSHVLLIVGVGQREHRVFMLYLSELGIQVAAHTLGRRVGVCHLGVLRFQVL